jgi:hypothetical protein
MTRPTGNWIESCPTCYCSVSNQLKQQHMQYHENEVTISENEATISEAKSAAGESIK